MNIIAKNIEMSNCVAVFGERFILPEMNQFLSLFSSEELKGSNFADDQVMKIKVFDLPSKHFKYIFEKNRFRIEEYNFREPKDSRCAEEMKRILSALYTSLEPISYGYNYDVIYRFDSVIPQKEIMESFISPEIENVVKDFGWQFTLRKDKNRRIEVYFFKVVSPIELRLHVNYHFNNSKFPQKEKFQEQFERCYTEIDSVLKNLSF